MTRDELAALPYDELKAQAIAVAEHRRDLSFFYELFRHTSSLNAAAAEGGSLGDLSGSLIDMVTAAHEIFGSEKVGDMEPLFRTNFEDNLLKHTES